ncbi:MAG: hypothetical protein ACK56I_22845, partial [bacterium]
HLVLAVAVDVAHRRAHAVPETVLEGVVGGDVGAVDGIDEAHERRARPGGLGRHRHRARRPAERGCRGVVRRRHVAAARHPRGRDEVSPGVGGDAPHDREGGA